MASIVLALSEGTTALIVIPALLVVAVLVAVSMAKGR